MGKLTDVDKLAIRDSFLAGNSSEEIAPFFGISPQYVRQMVKDNEWRELREKQAKATKTQVVTKVSSSMPQITAQDLVLLEAKNSTNFRKDNPIVRQAVLNELSKGVSLTAAARKVGVNHKTLKAWREKDPEFDIRCYEAQADFISSMEALACGVETPKDALMLLGKHPLTKAAWAPQDNKSGGITVNLNFDRNSMLPAIEGECKVIDVPQIESD